MFDFISFAETHSVGTTIAVVLFIVVIWLAIREARDIWRDHKAAVSSIMLQEKAIFDEEKTVVFRKDILIRVAQLCDKVEKLQAAANIHFEDVSRIASDEHWKQCKVDKCPNLPGILAACKQTNDALSEIASQLRQLSIEMIATLRSFRGGADVTD